MIPELDYSSYGEFIAKLSPERLYSPPRLWKMAIDSGQSDTGSQIRFDTHERYDIVSVS